MTAPLVSVCIGTYNRERYVRECLDSVFAQTYPNLEVIVVDNASTDHTVAIVESYGEKVRLIKRSVNSGMCSTTRNQAVQSSHGFYVAFLDSDDCWYPEKIEKQVQFMQDHEAMPLCHTYCSVIDAKSAEQGIRHEGKILPSGKYFEALLNHCWITISSVVIKRSLYEECGPFTEALPYGRSGEDYEFFLKVARKYDIGFIPEVLAKYRKGTDGVSGSDWRSVPEAFPFICCLWKRNDIWGGRVAQGRMNAVLQHSALASAQYWRDRGFPLRALWFSARCMFLAPWRWALYAEAAKSFGSFIFRPREMKIRRMKAVAISN